MRAFVTTLLSALALGQVDYSEGGANWAATAGNELCGTGTRQSPIDLTDDDEVCDSMDLSFANYIDYTTLEVENKGYTIQFNLPSNQANGQMTRVWKDNSQQEFQALQFNLHAPSEHTVNGELMDLELHIVHQYPDGSLGAALGIFFDTDVGGNADNLFIDQLINGVWPAVVGNSLNNREVSLQGFIANTLDTDEFWSYDGSLTTPPCTEGIKWTVMKRVQSITPTQLARFTDLWAGDTDFAGGNGNNRVIQPRNDRDVYQQTDAVMVRDREDRRRKGGKAAVIVLAVLLGLTCTACLCLLCYNALQDIILTTMCGAGCLRRMRQRRRGRKVQQPNDSQVAAEEHHGNRSMTNVDLVNKANDAESHATKAQN